ncbi:MAG: Hsp20/alpha crystallin family protein [Gammaproteobacteria bacterium]|jgi:HSP20 family protein
MELRKLSPWNWFKKEKEHEHTGLPVSRPETSGAPLTRLHTEIDRMFDDFFRGSGMPDLFQSRWPETSAFLKPKLDISENDEQYKIDVEVPGISEKDIKVDIEGDMLTIRGEKQQENKTDKDKYHCIERSYGSFMRTLNLPSNADTDNINAKFKNGVLTININKTGGEPVSGKTINIEKD